MINENILEKYNAEILKLPKSEYIFVENGMPLYYFQIIRGGVKMNHFSQNGNEFIQGIFGKGKSFGEPPILTGLKYPANAITLRDTILYRLPIKDFKKMLIENPNVHYEYSKTLSQRIYYKAVMANSITSNSAEKAVHTLLLYVKYNVFENIKPFDLKIHLTRKNIAGLTGLSIESTIRTLKKMENKGIIKMINRKIYI